jgi:hypothetical protein
MSRIINPYPALGGGYTTIIRRPGNTETGIRVLCEPFGVFKVLTFPFSAIAQVVGLDELQAAGSYMLCERQAPKTYVGESGNLAKRLPDHITDPNKQFATEIFVVTSKDERFKKKHAVFGQRFLFDAAKAAGLVTLVNDIKPQWFALDPEEIDYVVRGFMDIQRPLFDSGCRVLHDRDPMLPPVAKPHRTEGAGSEVLAGRPLDDSGEIFVGPATVPLGAEQAELKYSDIWARGYLLNPRDPSDTRFVVAPGSEIRTATNGGVINGIVTKRNTLEEDGFLMPIPGVSDRKRLVRPIVLCSKDNAAKVCAGAMIDANSWRLANNEPTAIDLERRGDRS